MRRALLFFFLVSSFGHAEAQSLSDGRVKIAEAALQSDLRLSGPYVVVARVRAGQGTNSGEGKYRLIWLSPERWREDVVMGPDFLSEMAADGKTYTKSSSPKAAFVLSAFRNIGAYPHSELPIEGEITTKSKKLDDEVLSCFQFKTTPEQEVCLNKTGYLVNFNNIHYGDFRPTLGKQFPYSWVAHINGVNYSGAIEQIQPLKAAPNELFAADGTWRETPVCRAVMLRPARKASGAIPPYPALARQAHVQGAVLIHAWITPDGELTDVEAVSGHPMLRDVAVQTVKQWKYQPTTCDGVAVPVETEITVNFSLGG